MSVRYVEKEEEENGKATVRERLRERDFYKGRGRKNYERGTAAERILEIILGKTERD